ncbi:hypothetical protein JCM19239_3144 [Vibrio variabilis]|uniref:Uncharacterized protein n=1 Tax=Vibrio variabilis TaxID=990271 RepID=A0ABQ0JR62_9VIBR|nr:hypothetical protein JCM19239_3144 [Vibrio variabilis]
MVVYALKQRHLPTTTFIHLVNIQGFIVVGHPGFFTPRKFSS